MIRALTAAAIAYGLSIPPIDGVATARGFCAILGAPTRERELTGSVETCLLPT
jgi:hypothetical protein